jgi:hypothetical protein
MEKGVEKNLDMWPGGLAEKQSLERPGPPALFAGSIYALLETEDAIPPGWRLGVLLC